MKPFGDTHGYRTEAERRADPLDVVDYTPSRFDYDAWHKRMNADARQLAYITLAVGFCMGAGFGFVVGVWLATH